MDGVLVREEHALPGAAEFLQRLADKQRRFLVLTNNSIFTPRDLAARLKRSGLTVPEESIWTSATATAAFLHDQLPGGSAYVIGEAGLTTALHEVGYTLYMDMLERAVKAIRAGRTPQLDRPLDHGPEVGLGVPALIPEDYLPDVHARLMLYKRIASCADAACASSRTARSTGWCSAATSTIPRRGRSAFAQGRCSRSCCWPTRSTARRPRCRARCWR